MRYVVLHHTGIENPHFDFMFEPSPDGLLETVRCSEWPVTDATELKRLPDHRRAYLDYEGPVSGDRGEVRRVASGTCAWDGAGLRLDTGLRLPIAPRRRAGA